jgi:hypothetical protein
MKRKVTRGSVRLTTSGPIVIPRDARARATPAAAWFAEIAGCVSHGDPVGDLERDHEREIRRDARRRP